MEGSLQAKSFLVQQMEGSLQVKSFLVQHQLWFSLSDNKFLCYLTVCWKLLFSSFKTSLWSVMLLTVASNSEIKICYAMVVE